MALPLEGNFRRGWGIESADFILVYCFFACAKVQCMKIYIPAIIKADPAHPKDVIVALQLMVEESRKETARIQYNLHQAGADEHEFIFYKVWESRVGLDSHNQQPYMRAFGRMDEEKLQEAPLVYIMNKIA